MLVSEMVELSDERVLRMKVADCGEPLVEIGACGTLLFGDPPECPETAPHYRWVRQGVARRLEQAQAALPEGLRLRLYEGYRCPSVQAMIFAGQLGRTTAANPQWNPALCFQEAAKLASPLHTFAGEPILPPHSTGGAVDIEIVDEDGRVIDFGMEAKDWVAVEPELCATAHPGLSAAARRNRDLLVDVMEAAGFVNYPREWWHFSYGDKYWAFLTRAPAALYGRADR